MVSTKTRGFGPFFVTGVTMKYVATRDLLSATFGKIRKGQVLDLTERETSGLLRFLKPHEDDSRATKPNTEERQTKDFSKADGDMLSASQAAQVLPEQTAKKSKRGRKRTRKTEESSSQTTDS